MSAIMDGPASHEYLAALAERSDALVVTGLGDSTTDWSHFAPPDRHLPICGAMGHAMSVALGLAVHRPEKKFLAIEGDGGVILNLGGLIALGAAAPTNLLVLVLNNGVYASSGDQPLPATIRSLSGIARECGVANAADVDSVPGLLQHYEAFLAGEGAGFISLRVGPRTVPRFPFRRRPAEIRATFARTIDRLDQHGRP
jgi:thiamine pyrophosphate-dependent acetolactate synthase large subunit-like protein